MVSMLAAEETAKSFEWEALKAETVAFTQALGMLDAERDEYATNLAIAAANGVADAKASAESLSGARRMIGLALQLSRRNKRAVIVNFQLAKGVLPEPIESTYSPAALARLLLARGQLLAKQDGEENQKLSRYFIQLSAELDPRNPDTVYASEVQRLDNGPVDWTPATGIKD